MVLQLVGTLACGDVAAPREQAQRHAEVADDRTLGESDAEGPAADAPSLDDAGDVPGEPSPWSLGAERDRLLDTVPVGRCAAWGALDEDQRAVFLLVTDLLGKRSALPAGASVLAHVVRLYAVRGRQHEGCLRCCGDREFNRAYLGADSELLAALRADTVVAWRDTRDLAGAHEPFTASRETALGQPRGQLHVFASDDDAVVLARPGVEDVHDASVLEIDLDFNLLHESAPLCEYGGRSGLARYQELWSGAGQDGDAELAYQPSGC